MDATLTTGDGDDVSVADKENIPIQKKPTRMAINKLNRLIIAEMVRREKYTSNNSF